jgi:hypothetical protein
MKVKEGCTGCNRYWESKEPTGCPPEQRNQEGQCSRCKRCLECCGHMDVERSCAWRFEQLKPHQQRKSKDSHERYLQNPRILRGHRGRFESS